MEAKDRQPLTSNSLDYRTVTVYDRSFKCKLRRLLLFLRKNIKNVKNKTNPKEKLKTRGVIRSSDNQEVWSLITIW